MGCLCEELAGEGVDISSTCIGHLWVFANLQPNPLIFLGRDDWIRTSDLCVPNALDRPYGFAIR
jgi:hypothetical protein